MRVCPVCGVTYEAPAQFCQRDGASLRVEEPGEDPYIGTRVLDHFRIDKVVGTGGMGVVYSAWDEGGLGRQVAVKILHRDLVTNREVVHRFQREAQIAHQLDHPHIVRLILFGQLPDGNLYLVLEFIEGPTLAQLLDREGPLPIARTVKILGAIGDAIGYAHRRDIVHRDLKPENVIVTVRDGERDYPKVLDFGIAKTLLGGDTMVTQAGLIFGTAKYISPEGARGESVDPRSDVYSLGIIAYQMLAGVTPFDGAEPVQLLLKHVHEAPPPLRSHSGARNISPAVEQVVMRCLAKRPEHRFADAAVFARALRDAAQGASPLPPTGASVALAPPVPRDSPAPRATPAPDAVTAALRAPPRDPAWTPSLPPHTTASIRAIDDGGDDDELLEVPGIPRRRAPSGRRLAAIVLSTVVLTLGAGFATVYALGLLPSQQLARDIHTLEQRATDALQAGRILHDPSGDDVDDLTQALTERAGPGYPRALELRRQALTLLRNQASVLHDSGHLADAVVLLRRGLRLTDGDHSLDEMLAAYEHEQQSASAPAVAPAPARPRSAPRPHTTAPGVPTSPADVPAVPVEAPPTFRPGRDPVMDPPVIMQPDPRARVPARPDDPNAGVQSF